MLCPQYIYVLCVDLRTYSIKLSMFITEAVFTERYGLGLQLRQMQFRAQRVKVLGKMQGVETLPSSDTLFLCEARPESKDTKVLTMYNIFNLQKRRCE